ncbi:hypothetical protein CDD82_2600 [Ophiocordyceps australis]|uniref:Uncharacterized protein n=1 Tax=Ophiocordyceps australis TaxID=1399860 RepID=A0A2C5XR76_9HYPO|nr:hypothetical protein CDD82_2600 [Ophiocordyceps australis]
MTESATQKTIEIIHRPPEELPEIKADVSVDELTSYVLVSETVQGRSKEQIFGDTAKGFFHFYGAVFTGTITDIQLAYNGEKIQLNMPTGLWDGARIFITWKWAPNPWIEPQRAEAVLGTVKLQEGSPTRFWLTKWTGAGDGESFEFWGIIVSKTMLRLGIRIKGAEYWIDMHRVKGT